MLRQARPPLNTLQVLGRGGLVFTVESGQPDSQTRATWNDVQPATYIYLWDLRNRNAAGGLLQHIDSTNGCAYSMGKGALSLWGSGLPS